MILAHLNYIAVLVCTVIYFGIGGLWFSPLMFIKSWTAGHGITMPTDDAAKAEMRKEMPKYMVITFIANLIGVIAIDYILTAMVAHNWMTGAKVGILASSFVCIAVGLNHMHTKKNFKTFLIDAGYHVVGLVIVGVILAVWH